MRLESRLITSVCSTFALFFMGILFATTAGAAPTGWRVPRFTASAKVLYAEASRPSPPAGAGVIVLDEEETYVLDKKDRAVYTEYMVYKVLSQQGVQGWDSLGVYWEPWLGPRPTIRARVITSDFAVHELDPKTISDAPAEDEQSNIYSDARVLRAPLPAVAPGSVVEREVVVRTSTLYPGSGMAGSSAFGRASVAVERRTLTLQVPSSLHLKYKVELLPGLQPQRTKSGGQVKLVFEQGPIAPLRQAAHYLPSNVPAHPTVVFSTGESWQEVAQGYAKIVDSHIQTASLVATVATITRGLTSPRAKLEALVQYADKQIRYTGVEFGNATVVPHLPQETLTRGYGDCKDKATLLVGLLRTAGIPAYVALLSAGERMDISPELPTAQFFDHAIVYVPGAPAVWIDPTDRYARLGQLPIVDQGRWALVAREGTQGLLPIPQSPAEDNVLLETRNFHLAEYGRARVTETSYPQGIFEGEYRYLFSDVQNKDVRSQLTNYMKGQYRAETLDRITSSDANDLSQPFQLTLESNKAKRGYTDLHEAVVAIPLATLFHRLPESLQKSADDEAKNGAHQTEKRTAGYQLPEGFVDEWKYTIFPPEGFQAAPLPQNVNLSFGPAHLTEGFQTNANQIVQATLRFDTGKRRLTVAEATELRNQVAQILQQPPILIRFEPVGDALADQGKMREAIQSFQKLIALHPQEAIFHLRLAQTLLGAGLGETARAEAKTAVKLDPTSALAEKTLAGILEHDIVGRDFRRGSDWAGAETAFRAAIKLDRKDKAPVANLAILLEYNHWGLRYGPGAKLNKALAEYEKLSPADLTNLGVQNNIAFAEFYDGEFAQALKDAESLNPQPDALIAASDAILNGPQAALGKIRQLTTGNEQFNEVAETAGDMLVNIRKYLLAADLEAAGASGDSASETESYAALYRQTVPYEQIHFANSPVGVAMRFDLLEADPDLTLAQLNSIASRNGRITIASPEILHDLVQHERRLLDRKARKGEFANVGLDLSIARAQPTVQGSDADGYKVTFWPSASYKESFYIVKEDGQYKVLGASRFPLPAGVGLEILDRLATHDLSGARKLLDWIRSDQQLAGGDDPLAGLPFPRFWTRGEDANPGTMKLAAASILTESKETAARGVAMLAAAQKTEGDETLKTNIRLALLAGYMSLRDYANALTICQALAMHNPESRWVFLDEEFALRALGRINEAESLAASRLKRFPGDPDATRTQIFNAMARGDYARAYTLAQKVVTENQVGADDWNNIAWQALLTGKIEPSDIQDALKAVQLTDYDDFSSLQTLASVYAATGKIKQAHDVLIRAMDAQGLGKPDPNVWYTLGLIAERCGERTAAISDYSRVTKPKEPFEIPESSYFLAQRQLKTLQAEPQ